jgi:GH35 family endo-1,4-beta-xylanase
MQWVYDILRENGITPSEYVVVNEPFFQGSGWIREDALYRVAGGYGYITQAFLDAREIVGPDAILILNDTANNSLRPGPYNYYTELTRKLVDQLREARVTNFAVGMQMHLRGDYPVDEEDLIATMRYYGVPVYITELDVDVSMLPSGKREQALVDFYTTVFRAAIRSGVCRGISTWNGVDDLSTPVDYEGNIDAQPTMFVGIDNPTPKRVYYEVLRLLLNELSRQ